MAGRHSFIELRTRMSKESMEKSKALAEQMDKEMNLATKEAIDRIKAFRKTHGGNLTMDEIGKLIREGRGF